MLIGVSWKDVLFENLHSMKRLGPELNAGLPPDGYHGNRPDGCVDSPMPALSLPSPCNWALSQSAG